MGPQAPARLATAAPPPFEQRAVLECAGVDTAIQALLQHGSGCTAHPFFFARGDAPNTGGIEEAMFLLARARIHAGRLQEGVELVLDVIRLAQDLTRGAPSLLTAHEGLLLQSEAVEQLNALLASDLPWTGAMLDELARQAQVLVSTMPEPTAWFAYEALSVRHRALQWLSLPGDAFTDGALRDIATEDYAETRWPDCAGVTLQACTAQYRAEIADVSARLAARSRWDWIPGMERQRGIEATYLEGLRNREDMLVRAARNEALLRALPALFLHRRMSLSGTCPTVATLQAEALAAGMAGGFEIVNSPRSMSILLHPPGAFSMSTEFLYHAVCPPLIEP
jgi:hypothetical protein